MRLLIKCVVLFSLYSAPLNAATFKLGSLAPEGTPWDKARRQMALDWKTASNGAVTVKIYAGGIAGDEFAMIRKSRLGQLDIIGLSGIALGKIIPDILALQAPLVAENDREFAEVFDSLKNEFAAALSEKGFVVLMWTEIGWTRFFSRQPVTKVDDLRKQKLFVWGGDPTGILVYKNLGFQPVSLSSSELLAALQSGMVDAFQATPLSAASFQWFGIAKNMCGMRWSPLVGAVIITKKSWESLPEDLRGRLRKSNEALEKRFYSEVQKADSMAIAAMTKYGLRETFVSDAALTEWKRVAERGIGLLLDKSFPARTYHRVKALAAAARGKRKLPHE